MMRKIAIALICALLLLTVFACGGKKEEAAKEKDEYTFGYITMTREDTWCGYSIEAFEYAASRAPKKVNVVVLDPKANVEESISAIESLIQQGVDGISIFPISPEQGAQLIKIANDAGIPITVENDMMDIPNPGEFIAAIACNYDDIGYAAIKFIAQDKPGAKIFYCAGERGGGIYEKYQEGVDKALAEVGSAVSIVGTVNTNWLPESAHNLTTDFINSGTQFDYVFANSGQIAQGVYQALKERGMDNIPIVSTGGDPGEIQFLRDGIEKANMTAPVSLQGVQTFKNLYEFVVEGKTPAEKRKALPIIPIKADELDKLISWDDYEGAYKYVYGE
ncbi:MAG: sugar ABC transporter substrate-binding protein [Treponema sp.]|jgi:ABC-type sugar transport system substrate-binding protein|nr:sugar ABC transporter substrate-binding protein [Treponema sp.]